MEKPSYFVGNMRFNTILNISQTAYTPRSVKPYGNKFPLHVSVSMRSSIKHGKDIWNPK